MADVKKPAGGAKKPEPAAGPSTEFQMLFFGAIFLIVFFIVIPTVVSFFGYSDLKILPENLGERASEMFSSIVNTTSFISIFVTLMLAMAYYYLKMRTTEIMDAYESGAMSGYRPEVHAKGSHTVGVLAQKAEADPRWKDIEAHLKSNNQSDWRVAILEADIILYDMLTQMGYEGDSIGEMLKQADPATFATLQDAWRAHRVRNTIAHEGANYVLPRHEAEHTLALYKRVFDEFYFV